MRLGSVNVNFIQLQRILEFKKKIVGAAVLRLCWSSALVEQVVRDRLVVPHGRYATECNIRVACMQQLGRCRTAVFCGGPTVMMT
ncbi:hypothetical protein F511_28813 [Dorcoceras hygrometricum]|uniref:Uncharacterized protein n=1 Tax=Dorcoceras hygrometricum TaxID=472368 RepID=A0A2Z7BQX4_9LAMI|nr:hypothetical protein F511_28813 [Dorcoceras hygrometricum]